MRAFLRRSRETASSCLPCASAREPSKRTLQPSSSAVVRRPVSAAKRSKASTVTSLCPSQKPFDSWTRWRGLSSRRSSRSQASPGTHPISKAPGGNEDVGEPVAPAHDRRIRCALARADLPGRERQRERQLAAGPALIGGFPFVAGEGNRNAGALSHGAPRPRARYNNSQVMNAPRRRTVLVIAGSGLAAILAASTEPGRADAGKALFREVTPGESRIDWVHENARSRDRYLPETTGAGAALLDFDGDGWMDVYLVNSGPCELLPAARPAPRTPSTATTATARSRDVTAKAGVDGGDLRDGRRGRRLRQRRPARPLRHRLTAARSSTATTATGRSPTSPRPPGWPPWLDDERRLLRLRRRRPPRSLRRPLRALRHRHPDLVQRRSPRPALLLRAAHLRCAAEPALSQRGRRALRGSCAPRRRLAGAPGKALGVVATDLDGDGRQDLFVANDTAPNHLFMNRGGARFEDVGARRRGGVSAPRHAAFGHGRRRRGLGRRRQEDLALGEHRPRDLLALPQQRERHFVDEAEPNGLVDRHAAREHLGAQASSTTTTTAGPTSCSRTATPTTARRIPGRSYLEPPLLLFHNEGGRYRNVERRGGPGFEGATRARPGGGRSRQRRPRGPARGQQRRGAAPAAQRVGRGNHWLGVRLQGTVANRDAVGAGVTGLPAEPCASSRKPAVAATCPRTTRGWSWASVPRGSSTGSR